MHWCYVSARNRTMRYRTSRSDARTMQSQSRTLRMAAARAFWLASQLGLSLVFAAAKRPKSHLTTGNRSLSSNIPNFSACRFENPHPSACLIEASSC